MASQHALLSPSSAHIWLNCPPAARLRGITDMTALLGKREFERILGSLIYKPSGKPVLVRDSDRRPEYNTAKSDFEE